MTPRGGAAAVTPAATAASADAEKTAIDPKIFVVVGLLIAAAIIGSFTTGLIGGKSNSDAAPDVTQVTNNFGDVGPPPPPIQQVAPPSIQPPTNNGGGGGNTQVTSPQFKILVPPDPRQPVGTMGIVVNTPNISPAQALAMAKSAKQSVEAGGKWAGIQVVVFNNQDAAVAFRKYQAQRKGARLTAYQYQDLANQGVWSSVPVYYETRGKTGRPYYPANNPKGWWGR